MKKLPALLLSVLLILACLPASVLASPAQEPGKETDKHLSPSEILGEIAENPDYIPGDTDIFDSGVPYPQPDEEKPRDTGKLILHGIIGLVILVAIAALISGLTGDRQRRKNRSAPPESPQPRIHPPEHPPVKPVFCTNCGKPIPPTDRFCPHCGSPQDVR